MKNLSLQWQLGEVLCFKISIIVCTVLHLLYMKLMNKCIMNILFKAFDFIIASCTASQDSAQLVSTILITLLKIM